MKRYTISKFLNVVMTALIVFVSADLLVSVYMLLNGGSKLYIAVSTLLFLTGILLLMIYPVSYTHLIRRSYCGG